VCESGTSPLSHISVHTVTCIGKTELALLFTDSCYVQDTHFIWSVLYIWLKYFLLLLFYCASYGFYFLSHFVKSLKHLTFILRKTHMWAFKFQCLSYEVPIPWASRTPVLFCIIQRNSLHNSCNFLVHSCLVRCFVVPKHPSNLQYVTT
jgi:hypothetical protein